MSVREHWTVPSDDKAFWIASALILVACAPFIVPILTPTQVYDWSGVGGDLSVSLAVVVALSFGLRGLPRGAERTLWRWVVGAYCMSGLAAAVNTYFSDPFLTSTQELFVDVVHLVFYLVLLLAPIAALPAPNDGASWRLHLLRHVGLGVAGVGFLVYSQAIPFHANPDTIGWYPGLFLYASLDVAVATVFLRARKAQRSERLRAVLAWLAAVHLVLAVADLGEALLWIDPLRSVELSAWWDPLWWIPSALIVTGARAFLARPSAAVVVGDSWYIESLDRGSLVIGLCALPFAHALLSYLGVVDPELREARDALIVCYLVSVGLFAFVYFRALERQRSKAADELELSEERYRSLAFARSEGLYRLEPRGRIDLSGTSTDIVQALKGTLSVAEAVDKDAPAWGGAESVGTLLSDIMPATGVDADLGFRRWVEEGYRTSWSTSYRGSDNAERHATLSLVGITREGELVRAWLARTDVTDALTARAEAERLTDELRQARKLESLGTLAGGIAHDFNNLLLPIIGFAEMAQERLDTNPSEAHENLEYVVAASAQAAELVEQILAVSREQPRRSVAVKVDEVVQDAVRLVRSGLPPRIRVDVEIGLDVPHVVGDPARLHQVVMNLCTNAAQAIGDQPGTIAINLSTQTTEGDSSNAPASQVTLTVQDSGPGVPDEVLDRVFDPFFTTKPVGEGTGLGLSVVHGIVLSHRGEIEMSSSVAGGAIVTVVLPAGQSVPEADGPTRARVNRSLAVLLVDDDDAVATVTKRMLEAEGHIVESFADPRAALARVHAEPDRFDVAVTDSWMPQMSGSELAEALQEAAPDVGIVLSSGYHVADAATEYVKLRKPFVRATLNDAIARAQST